MVRMIFCIVILFYELPVFAQIDCQSGKCNGTVEDKKTPMEKLKDERVLHYLNKLWDFYYNRNLTCFTIAEKSSIESKMLEIRYPSVSAEKMSSADLRLVILSNAESLGFILEKELANPCLTDVSLGTDRKILKNLQDLHSKVEQKIDDPAFWLWDQVEYMKAGPRRHVFDFSNR